MAGVMINDAGVEFSGVYRGVLKEDMVTTVQRVKKPFIDVYVDTLFYEDADYPLTYVPMFNMILPLKKDQEVWVYFNQENHRYPVLWKLATDMDEDYTDAKFTLPPDGSLGLVTFPETEDTTEVLKFSDNMWFIGTADYGVLHWGDQCVLLDKDSIRVNADTLSALANAVKVEIVKDLQVKAAGNIYIEVQTGGKVLIGNPDLYAVVPPSVNGLLGNIIDELFDILLGLTTVGSPTTQTISPSITPKLAGLQAIWKQVFVK